MPDDAPSPAVRGGTPLRLGLITRSMFPLHGHGGLERHVADLVRHLLASNVHVTVITRPPASAGPGAGPEIDRPSHPRLAFEWVPYRTFPLAGRRGTTVLDRSTAYPVFGWRAGRRAVRLVAEGRLDLVHGLGASALGYALARRRTGRLAPFVFNPQGLEEFGATDASYAGARFKRLVYSPLQRAVVACARAADRVIATDQTLRPVVERHLGLDPARVVVIPNAVDLETCDRLAGAADGVALRTAQAIAPDEPVLLSVGRLELNKGFHVLADALAGLAARRWTWVIAGDGPYRRELERRVDRHRIRSRVRLAGRVDDRTLHAWYEAATLFVHPTLYEGSSLVTLEAMAHRRAVVGTAAGGLPDKIRPGETGWLVDPGNPDALAGALADALDHRVRLPAMGREGRALVEAAFAWPVVMRHLLALYAEVLGEAGHLPSPGDLPY